MRQAGRYLPEYRQLRSQADSFIDFCLNPQMAGEATLQPLRRFDLDAAIVFADILLIPFAMNRGVHFVAGEGPKMTPLSAQDDLDAMQKAYQPHMLDAVGETIERVREVLPKDKALIGFAGAPWTVATYMTEGGGSRDKWAARVWAWKEPQKFDALLRLISEATIDYLHMQANAGADVLQLFESWAENLSQNLFTRCVIEPTAYIVRSLRERGVKQPIIGFPRGCGAQIGLYAQHTGVNAVSLDQAQPVDIINQILPQDFAVQGNLDPAVMRAGGVAMEREIESIIKGFSTRPHVFNLGHGITPDMPIEHMSALVSCVKGLKS